MKKLSKILIVEDESIVAFNIQTRLEEMGYEVSGIADSGKAAIDYARITKPNLVLMDIRIKGNIDGIEAANQIREQFHIPVIYLTAYADPETLERAKISEPYGYLIKPFESRELSSAIEIAIYKHGIEQKIAESEQWLTTTLRSIGDGVITTDENGIVNFLNAVAEELTGWQREEAVGQKVTEILRIVDEKTRLPAKDTAAIALTTGEIVNLENNPILIAKNYLETPIEASAAPIQDEAGNIKGSVIVLHDISERKQAEAALQKLNEELERKVQERTQELQQTVERLEAEIADRQRAEAALRQSEERFRNLVETSSDLVWEIDENDVYTYVSPKVRELLGYAPEEIIGKTPFELMPPLEARRLASLFAPITGNRQSFSCIENTNIHKNGNLVVLESSGTPIFDVTGKLQGYRGIDRDITERKRSENALLESQTQLQAILDYSPAVIYLYDVNNRYLLVNQQFENLFNKTKEEIIGKSLSEFWPPEIAAKFAETNRQVIEGRKSIEVEEVVPQEDGIHTYLSVKFPLYDTQGEPYAVCGISTDITDRKRSEQALQESEARFQKLVANVPGMIYQYVLHPDGGQEFPYVSARSAEIWGIEPEEISRNSQTAFDVVHPEDRSSLYEATRISTVTLQPWQWEGRIITPSGQLKWVQGISHPEKQANGDIIWDGLFIDITDRKLADETLKKTELRLGIALEAAHMGTWEWNCQTNLVIWSERTSHIFGFAHGAFPGTQSAFIACIHPDDREMVGRSIREALTTKTPHNCEHRIVWPDGTERWIACIGNAICNEAGEPVMMSGVVMDITDRKLAEDAFKNSEARLRMALNAAQMGTWEWDIANGKIDWSEQTELIYGFELGSFPGTYQVFFSCVHPDDRESLTETIAHTFQAKIPYHVEHRIIWPDGSVHWLIGKGDAIYDENDDPVGISGVVMDITDRKLAEEALRDSEFKLRTIIENSEDAITLKDTQGRYLIINPAGAKFLGSSIEDILGKRDEELFTPETGRQIWAADQKVMKSGTTWMYEEEGECDGIRRTFWSTKAPYLSPNGELLGIIGICRDITESKHIQETMRRQLAAVEAASDGIAILNAVGEYIYVNESHAKIFGYHSASELLGKTWRELYPAEEIQRLDREIFPQLMQNGKWQGEAIAKKRDGTTFAEELSLSLVGEGERELICVCRDITERKLTEQMLHLRDRAIAASNNGIVISDASHPERPIIYVNPAFERMTGYSAAEVMGQNCRFLQGIDKNQPGLQILRNALREGSDCSTIVRNYRKDGSLFWNELSISPIYDDDGVLTHYIGIQTDITDRKEIEEERQATTSRLSALIENLQLGILLKNEYQQVVAINQTFCNLFNIPVVPAALFGADFSEFSSEYQWLFADPKQFIQRHLEILRANQVVTNEEIQMADGRILERDFVPIFDQNRYSGHLWMYRDITERKKAQVALQEAKNQLQAVLDAVPGFVSWINSDLEYIGVNRYLANSFNLLPENFISQKVGFLENSHDFAESMQQFFGNNSDALSVVIDQKINGCIRSYLVAIQKYQQGKAAVSVGIDITERKQAESELRTSLKEKEVLLKEIHHRVKNNLQVISSLLKLQSAYIKDEEALSLFMDSYNRVRSMALIHEKLYQAHDLAQINAPEYIQNLVENLHRSYVVPSTKIEFQMNIDRIELDVDTAIPCGLIINELVSNSLKYAFKGKSKGEIKIKFVRVEESRICLSVSDNGIGLPPDFEIEDSESLGLQLVCNLTAQLGGELEIDRADGLKFDIKFSQQLKGEK